jgi:hypothetical protein
LIHWEKFLEFEERHGLFQWEEDGLYIWDILRFHVYVDFIWDTYRERQPKPSRLKLLLKVIRRIGYLLVFPFRRGRPNLFHIHSRDRDAGGLHYDKNADDFLQRLAGESYVLETFEEGPVNYRYPVALFNPATLLNRLYFFLYRRKDYTALVEKINSELELRWDNRTVNRHISYFRSERLFYKWLFRLKKIKRVYTTNHYMKGLFCAARENKIETVELQHGIIDKGHIGYHYPLNIHADGKVYCPDMLLTFSDFWCQDCNYPVSQIVPVGSTVFTKAEANGKPPVVPGGSVVFISTNVFGMSLAALAIDYVRLNPDASILFKLHPNQYSEEAEYMRLFRPWANVRVVANEQPMEELILHCSAIVLIQSTIAYQALQAGVPLFIYKRMTYYRHSHIFDSPNVKLIDRAGQIVITDHAQPGPKDIFFEEFDETVYLLVCREQS